MARKNSCCELDESEFLEEGDIKTFFYRTALQLLNLAMLMVKFANNEIDIVYYPDEKMNNHFPPLQYEHLVKMDWNLTNTMDKNKWVRCPKCGGMTQNI
jgi:hypothetical protein